MTQRALFKLLAGLALLPYVSIVDFPMDTAPYFIVSIILCIPVLIFSKGGIRLQRRHLAIIVLVSIFVGLLLLRLSLFRDLDSFRVFGNYSSVLISLIFFSALRSTGKNKAEIFLSAVADVLLVVSALYFLASTIQLMSRISGLTVLSEIIQSLISRGGRTSEGRGFNSLTAEPSYAGIVCSLIGCLNIFLYQSGYVDLRKSKWISLLCATTGILASSVTAMPFLVIFAYYYARAHSVNIFGLKTFFLLVVGSVIIISAIDFENLRAFQLAKMATSDERSVRDDVSAISRFASIVNYSLPIVSGRDLFGNVFQYVDQTYVINIIKNSNIGNEFKIILINGAIAEGGGLRTKSAISQSFFLFGIFGIVFWIFLIMHMRRILRKNIGAQALLLSVVLGYLIQIPLGHPTFLLVIGIIFLSPVRTLSSSKSTQTISSNQP